MDFHLPTCFSHRVLSWAFFKGERTPNEELLKGNESGARDGGKNCGRPIYVKEIFYNVKNKILKLSSGVTSYVENILGDCA